MCLAAGEWHKHLDDDTGHAWFRGLLHGLAQTV